MKNHTIMLWSYGLSTLSAGILLPVYAFFVQKVGGGLLETATAAAAFSIVTGLTTIILSRTAWYHRYKMSCMACGWFLWFCGIVGYLLINNVTTLFITEALSGFGSALSNPAFDAEFAEATASDAIKGWGNFEGTSSILNGIAALLGGFIVTRYGFNVLIYFMIITATASFAILVYYIRSKKRSISSTSACNRDSNMHHNTLIQNI